LYSLAERKNKYSKIVSDDYYTNYYGHRNLEVLQKHQKLMCPLTSQEQD
jgi:hypothetical protein